MATVTHIRNIEIWTEVDGWIDGRKSVREGLVFTANCIFNDRRLYDVKIEDELVRTVRLNGVYTVLFKRWNWYSGFIDSGMVIV